MVQVPTPELPEPAWRFEFLLETLARDVHPGQEQDEQERIPRRPEEPLQHPILLKTHLRPHLREGLFSYEHSLSIQILQSSSTQF